MSFFETIRALLPKSKAFRVVQDSQLRRLIKGLAVLPEDVRLEMEQIYMDLYPETTRALAEWENQFAVLFANEQYGDTRQGILKALWRANEGGQTAQYLENILQKINPGIHVFENVPVKNPRDSNAVFTCMCGYKTMYCGSPTGLCGYKAGDSEFEPTVIINDLTTAYDIPNDHLWWENSFFVAGSVIRNSRGEIIYCRKLQLNKIWRPYIEYLILKIKPVQTVAVMFIDWTDFDPVRRR